jgi:hypothetical protein
LGERDIGLAVETHMVDLFLGWSWRVLPRWHCEQGLIGGVGRSRMDLSYPGFFLDGTAWKESAIGFSSEYGFTIGTAYMCTEHLQIGVDLRHLTTTSRATLTGTRAIGGGGTETVSIDAETQSNGMGLSAWIGYRF